MGHSLRAIHWNGIVLNWSIIDDVNKSCYYEKDVSTESYKACKSARISKKNVDETGPSNYKQTQG